MPNQPLINALMGGQMGQQQPFGSNIFGTNNQQWGAGGAEQMPQTYQQGQTISPWPQQTGEQEDWSQLQSKIPQGLQWLFQLMMQGRGNRSPFFTGPPTGMPQGWGQQQPWGQQGGQG